MPDKNVSRRSINKRIDTLQNTMNDLYSSVYSTRTDNRQDMDRITTGIEDNLDDLLSAVNNQNISDISNLIIRLQRKGNNAVSQMNDQLNDLLVDKNVIDSINMENITKFIQAENYQYDLILKYVPKLYQALEIMKDNVLSSDNFTKDFINAVANKSSEEAENIFSNRSSKLIDKYEVQDLFEEMYMETAIYGEYFLYQVPYKTAFERLLKRKMAPTTMKESLEEHRKDYMSTSKVIFESSTYDPKVKVPDEFLKMVREGEGKVVLKMDPYGIIPEAVQEVKTAQEKISQFTSLTEAYMNEAGLTVGGPDEQLRSGTAPLKNYNNALALSHDGMFAPIGDAKDKDIKVRDISGCVMYKIPRENVIPLYIGDYCIGYYYFNIVNDNVNTQVLLGNTFNSLTSTSKIVQDEFEKQNDALVHHIASQLSQAIDSKFINSNVDLKEEIYAVLRYSDQFDASRGLNEINVCFIPAEDIHHFYFKLDKRTHRGISDLRNAVTPAMIYILLYLTDTINKVSRSQDKRIYYVKQNVEQNVARTMLNVITQIKKGNMGIRQLNNMNTIFNVIGKYNDHVIPMSQTGDAPIQFEVMQGQQIDTPTELMDRQEEAAVNSTDVPYEFVQSVNQVDYATRFTMSNSKFLRKVFKRQYVCQKHFSQIFRKLYNFEYNENETAIEILLPAPAFLTMTNSQQLLDNIKNFANAVAELEIIDNEELKPEFVRLLARNYLGSYIDFSVVEKLVVQAKHNISKRASEQEDLSAIDDGGDEF